MPLLIPVLLLLALFVLALLLWPVTLWRRARRGHLRRRVAPWAVHLRSALLGIAAAVFATVVALGWSGAPAHEAALGLGLGMAVGALAAASARIEADARAIHVTPRWGFAVAIALVVAARVAWLGWHVAHGEGWLEWRRHAAPLGGLLVGYAFARSALLGARLRRRRRSRLA